MVVGRRGIHAGRSGCVLFSLSFERASCCRQRKRTPITPLLCCTVLLYSRTVARNSRQMRPFLQVVCSIFEIQAWNFARNLKSISPFPSLPSPSLIFPSVVPRLSCPTDLRQGPLRGRPQAQRQVRDGGPSGGGRHPGGAQDALGRGARGRVVHDRHRKVSAAHTSANHNHHFSISRRNTCQTCMVEMQ